MSSSRRSNVSRTGSYPNVDPQRNQVLRQPSLRGNNPRNQLHRTANRTALPMRPFPPSPSATGPSTPSRNMTNLDSFLHTVTPFVPTQKKPSEFGVPYYCLEDLWVTFQEWSAYGAGVPYLLNGVQETTQYYVPYLSGMQLYIDPYKAPMINGGLAEGKDVQSHGPDHQTNLGLSGSFATLNLNNQKLKQVASSDNIPEVCGPCGMLAFEFFEQERPHIRKPLSLQASHLGFQFPQLSKYRSCDLLPSSWICVAWYPIYRIPAGPILEELDACFLTLHSLSTQPGSYSEPVLSNNRVKIRLPAIGLLSYKLKGSIVSPCDPYERGQEKALMMSACNWLDSMRVSLPDYQFFISRYAQ